MTLAADVLTPLRDRLPQVEVTLVSPKLDQYRPLLDVLEFAYYNHLQ